MVDCEGGGDGGEGHALDGLYSLRKHVLLAAAAATAAAAAVAAAAPVAAAVGVRMASSS